jgi:hypothetical protein
MQAVTLMDAMVKLRRADELAEACAEVWQRDPHWREAIQRTVGAIEIEAREQIFAGLATGLNRLDLGPQGFGLSAP